MDSTNIVRRIDKSPNPSIYLIVFPATGRTFMSYVRFARKLPGTIGCLFVGESIYDMPSIDAIRDAIDQEMKVLLNSDKCFVLGHCGGNSLAQFICAKSYISSQILATIMIDVYPKASDQLKSDIDKKSAKKVIDNTKMLTDGEKSLALGRYYRAVNFADSLEKERSNVPTYIITNIKGYEFNEIRETHPKLKEIIYKEGEIDELDDVITNKVMNLVKTTLNLTDR